MKGTLKLSQKGMILVAVPLAFQLLFVSVLMSMLAESEQAFHREVHAKSIISSLEMVFNHFITCSRSVMMLSTFGRDDTQIKKYREASNHLPSELAHLRQLVGTLPPGDDRTAALEATARLAGLANESKKALDWRMDSYEKGNDRTVLRHLDELRPAVARISNQTDVIRKVAMKEKSGSPAAAQRNREQLKLVLICGLVLAAVLAISMAVIFNRGTSKRLAVLMDNTTRLAKGKPLNPPLEGADEIAHLDRVFREMAADLAAADQAKRDVMSMVSHDLRTPLTSIQLFLNMLTRGLYGQLNDSGQKKAQTADRNANRLIRMVSDFLDLDRLESGETLELKYSKTNTKAIIEKAFDSLRDFAEQNQISFVSGAGDEEIWADSDRLVQVLVNLVSNAVKFSPPGQYVKVEVLRKESWLEFRIIDRGRGIPPEHQETIFQRFKQVKAEDATTKKGSGLGLAICKAIVEQHKGEIGVNSEIGAGSTFWFRIPGDLPIETRPEIIVPSQEVETTSD